MSPYLDRPLRDLAAVRRERMATTLDLPAPTCGACRYYVPGPLVGWCYMRQQQAWRNDSLAERCCQYEVRQP